MRLILIFWLLGGYWSYSQDTISTSELCSTVSHFDSLSLKIDTLLNNMPEKTVFGNTSIGLYEGTFKFLDEMGDISKLTISLNFSDKKTVMYAVHSKVFKLQTENQTFYHFCDRFYDKTNEILDDTKLQMLLQLIKINHSASLLLSE